MILKWYGWLGQSNDSYYVYCGCCCLFIYLFILVWILINEFITQSHIRVCVNLFLIKNWLEYSWFYLDY